MAERLVVIRNETSRSSDVREVRVATDFIRVSQTPFIEHIEGVRV